jgi:hypothetical protein
VDWIAKVAILIDRLAGLSQGIKFIRIAGHFIWLVWVVRAIFCGLVFFHLAYPIVRLDFF